MEAPEPVEKFIESLDHPLPFVLFTGMAIFGLFSVLTFLFKRAGWTGPAAVTQHP